MKILLIDKYGFMLDFALRCKEAGHEVGWFRDVGKDGQPLAVGRGFGFQMVGDWTDKVRWADLIVLADNSKYLFGLESYRKKGFPIFGPGLEHAEWELDRGCGQALMQDCGLDVMEAIPFSSLEKARAFVLAEGGRWVAKPNADIGKEFSYVSKSTADMVWTLDSWKGKLNADFILQPFKKGVEVAVGGWFGRDGWVGPWCENFEHKKFLVGDLGMNTGEMGTVLKYCETSLLAEMLLKPLEVCLLRSNFTGYIDVAVIVDGAGTPWPLEFTCRPGWPLFNIQAALHKEPVEWMLAALCGQDTTAFSTDIATGVCIFVPDFPYMKAGRDTFGQPVYGWNKVPYKHFHPCEVENKKNIPRMEKGEVVWSDGIVTAGTGVADITGTGKTIADATDMAYANVRKLEVVGSPIYRTDIGRNLDDKLKELQLFGFCEEWKP